MAKASCAPTFLTHKGKIVLKRNCFYALKIMLFVSFLPFSVFASDFALAAGYEKKIKSDCLTNLYEAFLQPDKEPKGEVLGFGLTRISCDHEGSGVGYEKNERRLLVDISDNGAAATSAQKMNMPDQLGDMRLKTQKLLISQLEKNISSFEELQAKEPSMAAMLKKTAPPPIRRAGPLGGSLYVVRRPCDSEGEQCGYVEGHALIEERFWVEIQIEDHGAAQSDDAAVGAINQTLEVVDWGKLR